MRNVGGRISLLEKGKPRNQGKQCESVEAASLSGRGAYEGFLVRLTLTLKTTGVWVCHLLCLSSFCSPYFPFTVL